MLLCVKMVQSEVRESKSKRGGECWQENIKNK